jgi:hypothetical protein
MWEFRRLGATGSARAPANEEPVSRKRVRPSNAISSGGVPAPEPRSGATPIAGGVSHWLKNRRTHSGATEWRHSRLTGGRPRQRNTAAAHGLSLRLTQPQIWYSIVPLVQRRTRASSRLLHHSVTEPRIVPENSRTKNTNASIPEIRFQRQGAKKRASPWSVFLCALAPWRLCVKSPFSTAGTPRPAMT